MGHHYNVAPRYTPGSPALVGRDIAERVASEEKDFIQHALEGFWGDAQKLRAEQLGLRGIVEARVERRGFWEVHDLCTGEHFKRLFPEKLRKQGFKTYIELQPWEKKLIDENPPTDIDKYQKYGWFKIEVAPFQSFPTGYKVTVYRPEPVRP